MGLGYGGGLGLDPHCDGLSGQRPGLGTDVSRMILAQVTGALEFPTRGTLVGTCMNLQVLAVTGEGQKGAKEMSAFGSHASESCCHTPCSGHP